jgi:thymidylate kinase
LQQNGAVASLWCDTAAAFFQKGFIDIGLRAEDLLRDRHMDSRGFYVAAPVAQFFYHLTKKISKGELKEQQVSKLSIIYSECAPDAEALMKRMFSARNASLLIDALAFRKWDEVRANQTAIRRELYNQKDYGGFQSRAKCLLIETFRKVLRICAPTGCCVAILGPDGSGKSSVIEQYLFALRPAFRHSASFHLRPRLLRGSAAGETVNTTPHGQMPRGVLASTVKLLFLWADYVLGYYFLVRPRLMRSTLVVFDRYYHDMLVDARRFRYGGPLWLAHLVAALIPMPDLMIFLDAPANVLQTRKQEVAAVESARQVRAYRVIANCAALHERGVLVDAARPLDKVVDECVDNTLAYLEARTAKRLHLN